MNPGGRLGRGVFQLFHLEHVGEDAIGLEPHLLEHPLGLFTQGAAIDQEQDAMDPPGLEQPVEQTDDGSRLAGARRHRDQAGTSRCSKVLRLVAKTTGTWYVSGLPSSWPANQPVGVCQSASIQCWKGSGAVRRKWWAVATSVSPYMA